MAFSPQRMAGSLRLALSMALAVLVLLILQPPVFFIAPSLYMLFLVPHDTPQRCVGGLIQCLTGALLGTAAGLVLIICTGNEPIARVLGLAVCTLLSMYFFRASLIPLVSMSFGALSYMVISLWEMQIRAEQILHFSLWPMGTLSTVALCSVVVEFLLNRNDPLVTLKREMRARFGVLEQLFTLFATNAGEKQIRRQSMKLKRLAVTGQEPIHALLERVRSQEATSTPSLNNLERRILVLTRLLDLGAVFSMYEGFEQIGTKRLERICHALTAARKGLFEEIPTILGSSEQHGSEELDQFEQALCELANTAEPTVRGPELSCTSPSAPVPRRSLLVPDAFTNPAYFIYAFKLSVCATIVFVVYNALGWPGISACYYTVFFTGLSTTGATNRKLLFRFIGNIIGGVFIGIGCLAFVFPNIESVTPFLLVVAAVTFVGAWVAASQYFSYIGLQLFYSFSLLAYERLSTPTEIIVARDRLLSIMLGLIVMLIIFHQVHPERTVDTMRKTLARILHAEAELVRLMGEEAAGLVPSPKLIGLRTQIERLMAAEHGYAEVVSYEFEPDRTADMALSNEILSAMSTSADLMLDVSALPQAADVQPLNEQLKALRDQLANGLQALGRSLEQPAWNARQSTEDQPFRALHIAQPAIAQKTLDCYRQLQMFCKGVVSARV
jgi:multidrug resistance protein MdtO